MRRTGRLRWWVVLALMPGLLLRALVAPGFMPLPSATAALGMAVCHGQQVVPAGAGPGEPNHGVPGSRDHERTTTTCQFAATAGAAPLGADTQSQVSLAARGVVPPAQVREFFFERLPPSQFPPRGPPLRRS